MKYFAILAAVLVAACQPIGTDPILGDTSIQNMQYFHKLDIDTCFALIWKGSGIGSAATGGPGLSTIECDRVPPAKLIVVP